MEITRKLKAAGVLGAVAGTIILAGIGVSGTAYADDEAICTGVASPAVMYARTLRDARAAVIIASSDPCSGIGSGEPDINQEATYPTYYMPYYPYGPYVAYAPYYNATALDFQSQLALIVSMSEVLGVPPQTIAYQLAGGMTPSQVAAGFGWQHDYFLTTLIYRIQYDASLGLISYPVANALLASLTQPGYSAIDVAGLPIALQSISFQALLQML